MAGNGVAIIHHLTIENTSDRAYRKIKIKIHYYPKDGTDVSWQIGILPVIVPTHSETIFLE